MSSTVNGSNQFTLLSVCPIDPEIPPNNDVVSAVQAGSPGAFAELHAIYSRRLYKRVLAITKNPEDAEDVLQETFLRAYSAIHTFEGRSTVYSWLTRIAINSALMVLRRRRVRAEILFDPQPESGSETPCFEIKDSAPDPEEVYALRQRRVRLMRAIRHLNVQLRTPLEMQMAKGAPIKEIGRTLSISEGAVKARLNRARRQLSAHFGRSEER